MAEKSNVNDTYSLIKRYVDKEAQSTMLLLFVVLFFTSTFAYLPCTRERIINCMLTWVDRDLDGKISAADINGFFTYRPCGPNTLHAIGENIVANRTDGGCDADGSGYLEEADYDDPNSCMTVDALQLFLCNMCNQCEDFDASKKRQLNI